MFVVFGQSVKGALRRSFAPELSAELSEVYP